MSGRFAITGARIFDGETWHDEAALVVSGDTVEGIVAAEGAGRGIARVDAGGGLLVPGFVDLQVNGGGGLMINDRPACRHDPHASARRMRRSARRRCWSR